MSKQDRKETSTSTTSSTTKDNVDQAVQINSEIFNRAVEENTQSLNQAFDAPDRLRCSDQTFEPIRRRFRKRQSAGNCLSVP